MQILEFSRLAAQVWQNNITQNTIQPGESALVQIKDEIRQKENELREIEL